jgi:hypothetical protein
MTAERWETPEPGAFQEHNGIPSLFLEKKNANLKDLVFRDGTIEFDVDPPSMGAGIGFRKQNDATYEDFYIRPDKDCATVPYCIQYAPQTHNILLWDLYPQYQTSAPVNLGQWNHVKLVVSGRRMNVFINDVKTPVLRVGHLQGDVVEGSLMLQAPGYFANFSVTPGEVEGLPPLPEPDASAADRNFLRHWQVTQPYDLADRSEPSLSDLQTHSPTWKSLQAETGGLLNVSREYGLPLHPPARSIVWLRTTVHSRSQQEKVVSLGWTREVWIFVNGHQVYAEKNFYQPASARKKTAGRCSLENGSFKLPLKKGNNEILVALANNFYGWGLIVRLDETKGVQLARR